MESLIEAIICRESSIVIGLKKYPILPEEITYEITLLPDFSEGKILDLCEVLLLANAGTLVKSGQHCNSSTSVATSNPSGSGKSHSNTIEFTLSPDHAKITNCQSIEIILGVKVTNKQRILLLHFKPYSITNLKLLFGGNTSVASFQYFAKQLSEKFVLALMEADNLFDYTSSGVGNARTLFGGMDIGFVRDLQAAYAMDMITALTAMADTLDAHVNMYEKRCAKLMTLLKPCYVRCYGLDAGKVSPVPSTKVPLTDYPLQLSRQSIIEASNESARQLLFHIRKQSSQSTLDLYAALTNEFSLWIQEESSLRTQRKTKAVLDRMDVLDQFCKELVWRLHIRYQRDALQQLKLPSFPLAVDERQYMEKAVSVCRLFGTEEPVLYDYYPVSVNGKRGTLYISANHIYFQPAYTATPSAVSWFGGSSAATTATATTDTTVLLLQTRNIASISVVSDGQMEVIPNLLSTEHDPHMICTLLASTPSHGIELLVIGQREPPESYEIAFLASASAGYANFDMTRRVADLLSIVVKNDLYRQTQELLGRPTQQQLSTATSVPSAPPAAVVQPQQAVPVTAAVTVMANQFKPLIDENDLLGTINPTSNLIFDHFSVEKIFAGESTATVSSKPSTRSASPTDATVPSAHSHKSFNVLESISELSLQGQGQDMDDIAVNSMLPSSTPIKASPQPSRTTPPAAIGAAGSVLGSNVLVMGDSWLEEFNSTPAELTCPSASSFSSAVTGSTVGTVGTAGAALRAADDFTNWMDKILSEDDHDSHRSHRSESRDTNDSFDLRQQPSARIVHIDHHSSPPQVQQQQPKSVALLDLGEEEEDIFAPTAISTATVASSDISGGSKSATALLDLEDVFGSISQQPAAVSNSSSSGLLDMGNELDQLTSSSATVSASQLPVPPPAAVNNRPKPSLGKNIQAFLAQSQKK